MDSGGGFFRGTNTEQDTRFSDKDKKLLQTTKFPEIYSSKVDFAKVNLEVIKPWITKRITEILGFEDDVLIGYIFLLLEKEKEKALDPQQKADPRKMQIYLTGFLEKNAGPFMKEMWTMLVSAQANTHGIPPDLLEKAKETLRNKRAESERIASEQRVERERIVEGIGVVRRKEIEQDLEKERQRRKEMKRDDAPDLWKDSNLRPPGGFDENKIAPLALNRSMGVRGEEERSRPRQRRWDTEQSRVMDRPTVASIDRPSERRDLSKEHDRRPERDSDRDRMRETDRDRVRESDRDRARESDRDRERVGDRRPSDRDRDRGGFRDRDREKDKYYDRNRRRRSRSRSRSRSHSRSYSYSSRSSSSSPSPSAPRRRFTERQSAKPERQPLAHAARPHSPRDRKYSRKSPSPSLEGDTVRSRTFSERRSTVTEDIYEGPERPARHFSEKAAAREQPNREEREEDYREGSRSRSRSPELENGDGARSVPVVRSIADLQDEEEEEENRDERDLRWHESKRKAEDAHADSEEDNDFKRSKRASDEDDDISVEDEEDVKARQELQKRQRELDAQAALLRANASAREHKHKHRSLKHQPAADTRESAEKSEDSDEANLEKREEKLRRALLQKSQK
mmetsp:Transcript_20803/g.34275  ORF Transcript_20803/g.34275 Transcript_20803/m.34275 type:complete len:626 (+) Transcript_20803:35-1912(+)